MSVQTLHDLLVNELRDLYHAEKQITKALPKMLKQTSNENLREAFDSHLQETENQISRLEKVFEEMDLTPRTEVCKGMEGIIEEGKKVMDEVKDKNVLDAALIASAQKVEHYEIASYGTARTYAELLGLDDVVDLLQETLDEEKAADEKLSQIAFNEINIEAKRSEE